MAMLEIQSLDAGYGAKIVLHDISLTVNARQFVSVVAPNGAGKTTLLKTITGLLPLLNGSIRLHGKNLAGYERRELARQVAVVGADLPAIEYTAQQMVRMGRFPHLQRFSGLSSSDHAIVQTAMEDVGMWDKRQCRCSELSQGERQKVIIARALAQQPKLLLLDEPTAHLDICNQYGVLHLLKQFALRSDMAVIAVIHDINLAIEFSTELVFLQNGRILACGEPRKIATPDRLQQLYGMNFTCHSDAAATYVRPVVAEQADNHIILDNEKSGRNAL